MDFYFIFFIFILINCFFIGFLFFIKEILPFISFIAKKNNKILLTYYNFFYSFDKEFENVFSYDIIIFCRNIRRLIKTLKDFLAEPRTIFFGCYFDELYYITKIDEHDVFKKD